MTELNQPIKSIPLSPCFRDAVSFEAIDADEVGRQLVAGRRKGPHRPLLGRKAVRVDHDFVALGDQEIDGFTRIWKGHILSFQVLPQSGAVVDLSLTKGAAVANEIWRDQFFEPVPVLPVDSLD